MNHRLSNIVGFSVAFVAGIFATLPSAAAQTGSDPVFSAYRYSRVTGVVRDSDGNPQIGALVELLNAHYNVLARTFTDDKGRYSLSPLGPGVYQIKAGNSVFLPTIRPNLQLLADSKVIVNLTLSTLYQALQWLPAEPRTRSSPPDDWDWTIRLAANRPLLRIFDPPPGTSPNGPMLVQTDNGALSGQKRTLAVHTGLARFGEGGLQQQISWSPAPRGGRSFLVAESTGADPQGNARISTTTAYQQQLSPEGSMLTVLTLTDRPSIQARGGSGLQTLHARTASTFRMGDLATIDAGTELEAARLGDGTSAAGSHPFGSIAVQLGAATVSYLVATSPEMNSSGQLQQEANEDAPAVTEAHGRLQIEEGLHQELRLSHEGKRWTSELSLFHDTLRHPVLEGAVNGDDAAFDPDDVLYDPGTGIIAVSGEGYSGGGVMAMLRDQLSPSTWLSLRYALGQAITAPAATTLSNSAAQGSAVRESSMIAVAGQTRIAPTDTTVQASYRWQPLSTLTQVAPFEPGIPNAYLSFSVRQPLHLAQPGASRIEAVIDVRNLLAQGYRPFLSQDGTTVYFAQAQRCIAAGLAFSF